MNLSPDAQIAERLLSDVMDYPAKLGQRQLRHMISLLESEDPQARLSASWGIGLAVEHDPLIVDSNTRRLARAVESEVAEADALRTVSYIAEHRPQMAKRILDIADIDPDRVNEIAPRIIHGYKEWEPSGDATVIGGRRYNGPIAPQETDTAANTDEETSDASLQQQSPRSPSSGEYPPTAPPPRPETRPISFEEFTEIETLAEKPWLTLRKVSYQAYGNVYPAILKQFHHSVSFGSSSGFDSEMHLWERLSEHPAVPTVVGWGEFPTSWVAHEYTGGESLADRPGAIPVSEALWIIEQISDVIQYAHNYGATHGGLTPETIEFVELFGDQHGDPWDYPKVTNWGVGRLFDDKTRAPLSQIPGHAAPEQIQPNRFGSIDAATDIYHLGVIAYQALTGRPPYVGETDAVLRAVLESEPEPVTRYNRSIPDAIGPIIQKSMATSKVERYETVQAFNRDLRNVIRTAGGQ